MDNKVNILVFLACSRNGNFSMGGTGFCLETDLYTNETLHWHWCMG